MYTKAIPLCVLIFSNTALSAEKITLKSPRGVDVNVLVHLPEGQNLPLVVLAPGQSCNSKGPLFEAFGSQGQSAGYAVARFEWNYCNSAPQNPSPSEGMKAEIEDMSTVLNYATNLPQIDKSRIFIAGKSLGSMVAHRVFSNTPAAKALLLLTPVCSYSTDEQNNPLPAPLPVTEESYPSLTKETRPVLMLGGNKDTLCFLPILYKFLGDSQGNIQSITLGGDHSFKIRAADGTVLQDKTDENIRTAVANALSWFGIQ